MADVQGGEGTAQPEQAAANKGKGAGEGAAMDTTTDAKPAARETLHLEDLEFAQVRVSV